MFYALTDLSLTRQKHIKSNFRSVVILIAQLLVEVIFVAVSSGLERAIILIHILSQVLRIRPEVTKTAPPITISLFDNSPRNRSIVSFCLLTVIFWKIWRFTARFAIYSETNLKYAELDNISGRKFAFEIVLLVLIQLISRVSFSIGFHQLKKTTVQLLRISHYTIFAAYIVFLFAMFAPDKCLTYNDLCTYYLLNLFAFNKVFLELLDGRVRLKKMISLAIKWGFAILASMHLNLDLFWTSNLPVYRTPVVFFLFTSGYFVLADIVRFHENLPEHGLLAEFQAGVLKYCVEHGKVDPMEVDVPAAVNRLQVISRLRNYLHMADGTEEIDHALLKFDRQIVQPTLEMFSQHRKAFILSVEVLVNLLIVAFVPISFDLDVGLAWLFFISSIAFKKRRRTFRALLITIYISMMTYYSIETFIRMADSSLTRRTSAQLFKSGFVDNDAGNSVLMRYILAVLFVLIQVNFYRKSPIKKDTEFEVRKKITEVLGKGSIGIQIWAFFWKLALYILNIVLFYYSILAMLSEINLVNFVFMGLVFQAVFKNSEDFIKIGRLMVYYQSVRVFLV